jgi:23S rRNA pseudouridine2605 synthase
MAEKIQKILANKGFGSRRQIEQWIKSGRITVDGKVAKIGDRIDASEKICIDGKRVKKEQLQPVRKIRVLMYHKPIGEICTYHDPQNRKTPFDHLPQLEYEKWVMIGRLDINTSGLLLFTNSGKLAHTLMHPSFQIERVYAVRVFGKIDSSVLERLKKGIVLEGKAMHFSEIKYSGGTGRNRWYHVSLKEGRNREVRRLLESQGLQVSRLMRIRFGPVNLSKNLKVGEFRELKRAEIDKLTKTIIF